MLLKKKQSCQNNPEKSYTEKKVKHEPSGWTMSTKCSLDTAENKLDYCRRRDCIEKLCKKLKDHAMKINNYREKEIIPLTDEENKSYEEQQICHICKKKTSFVWTKMMKVKMMKICKRLKITVIT